jgi:hypothetical protein
MTQVHTIKLSAASKLGGIPATYSEHKTCPDACPFWGKGCYAEGGNVAMHFRAVSRHETGGSFAQAIKFIEATPEDTLGRWNIAGDLPGKKDKLDRKKVIRLAQANKKAKALWFTFTHYPVRAADVRATTNPALRRAIARHNRSVIRDAIALGFAINVSANSPKHAAALASMGFDVASVAPMDWIGTKKLEGGHIGVQCPATIKGRSTTCNTCGMCQNMGRISATQTRVIPMFPAHGASKRKASAIAA